MDDRESVVYAEPMGLMDSLKQLLTGEVEAAGELKENLERSWSADLDRKEAELHATPSEKIDSLQDRIEQNSSFFGELRARMAETGPIPQVDDTDTPPEPRH